MLKAAAALDLSQAKSVRPEAFRWGLAVEAAFSCAAVLRVEICETTLESRGQWEWK